MSTQTIPTTTLTGETKPVDLKLEVVVLAVSDAERSKAFYESLGWRLDADFVFSETSRVLQFTPPGSDASIMFGTASARRRLAPAAGSCSPSRTSRRRTPISSRWAST
jgi:catechol 2,3-dioxygenase-like lactoylglutathione lyase family enzyme